MLAVALEPCNNLKRAVGSGKDFEVLNVGPRHVALEESTGASVSQADRLLLRQGDDCQGKGEQSQGAEVHSGDGAGGQARSGSARPGGSSALPESPPPLRL